MSETTAADQKLVPTCADNGSDISAIVKYCKSSYCTSAGAVVGVLLYKCYSIARVAIVQVLL